MLRRPSIVLPDIGATGVRMAPISDIGKQRAPLAEASASGVSAAKSLLSTLPTIDAFDIAASHKAAEAAAADAADTSAVSDAAANESAGAATGASTSANIAASEQSISSADALAALPSLEGVPASPSAAAEAAGTDMSATSSVSKVGAFVDMSLTGSFAPVGDELLQDVAPEEMYIDDVDDSDYVGATTETGAYAGPGYMEMPKSRVRGFFDRFSRKKKNDAEPSAQEWLNVDEAFDARSVGAARGSWESFRNDEPSSLDNFDDDTWQGGSFSTDQFDDVYAEGEEGYYPEDAYATESFGTDSYPSAAYDPYEQGDFEQVHQFHEDVIDTEVWFVALGSELSDNAGMKTFLAEHGGDMRGALIINLEALGAGELSMLEKEGMYKPVRPSSRMKRYLAKARQATGTQAASASVTWTESAASVALRHGYQAMTLAGMDGAKPAGFGQASDSIDSVRTDTLERNADFVMELIKNI